jgi:hypothetical protein
MTTMLCKSIIVEKSKEVKTGSDLVKYSKEGYSSKRAVLPMMIGDFGYTEQAFPK